MRNPFTFKSRVTKVVVDFLSTLTNLSSTRRTIILTLTVGGGGGGLILLSHHTNRSNESLSRKTDDQNYTITNLSRRRVVGDIAPWKEDYQQNSWCYQQSMFQPNRAILESSPNHNSSSDNNNNKNQYVDGTKLQSHRTTTSLGPWMDNIASLGCIPVVPAVGSSSPIEERLIERRDSIRKNFEENASTAPATATTKIPIESTFASVESTTSPSSVANSHNNENQKYQIQESNYINEYPNFARHRPDFLLKQYLTPQLYNELKNISKDNNNIEESIDDIMKSGVTLPYGGMNPMPHGSVAGIFIGYPNSYNVYKAILLPIIQSYHYNINDHEGSSNSTTGTSTLRQNQRQQFSLWSSFSKRIATGPNKHNSINTRNRPMDGTIVGGRTVSLQRHETNLNPKELVQRKLDDDGRYILYTRMRLARSIGGFPFPTKMNRTSRRQVEQILKSCVADWKNNNNTGGQYKSIMDMSNYEHEELIRRHVLYSNPDDFLNLAGFGNDWPDGRGLYCDTWSTDDIPNIIIWCNAYDHYWIISHAKGGNVQEVFTRLSEAVSQLEKSLQERNYHFVEDPQLGYLNSSLADIGTALRASVFIKLVRLGQLPGFHDVLCKKLQLQARQQLTQSDKEQMYRQRGQSSGTTNDGNTTTAIQQQSQPRYTGVFHIANAASLGKNEVELINIMIDGVAKCIELEKRLENGEDIDLRTIDV